MRSFQERINVLSKTKVFFPFKFNLMLEKNKKSVFSLKESVQLREIIKTVNLKYKTQSLIGHFC